MSTFNHINAKDLPELIAQGAIIVDIRDQRSFQNNRIKGSIHLSQENFQSFIDNTEFNTPIAVCCYHGISSQSASELLCEHGFEHVYSVSGGFENWVLTFPDLCEQG